MNSERRRKCAGLMSLVVCAGLITMTSCKKDSEPTPVVPVAYVSLYQASPNAPDLDIEVDDRQINTYPFDYSDHTGYLRFFTGQRNLKFSPTGASNVVIDTTVTFENDKAYSLFVVDEYADAGIILLNDNAATPATGKAKVRFLNLSPDTQAVDLSMAGEETPLFDDQAFKATADFKEIESGQHDFIVKSSNGSDVLLNIPDITFQSGWFYTILVRGYATPPVGNEHILSAQVIAD